MSQRRVRWRRGFFWVTLALFVFSLTGHWVFAWLDYVAEQRGLGQPVEISEYVYRTLEATFENWQSEFLQLIWQVVGLALLFFVGSPQSKEGDERQEEKLDWIMRRLAPDEAERLIADLDRRLPRS
ncbi:MAG: DUF6766 family protein [Kofleriaceae bacterium]